RDNVYPHREFLVRSRQDSYIQSCRHSQADNESSAHIIGYCPAVQGARIKRHNQLCQILLEEAKKKDWVVIQEPNIKDDQNNLYKLDLVFIKENQVVDIKVRYESKDSTLAEAAREEVEKHQHLRPQIQESTNTTDIMFFGFPLGACGKWIQGNDELPQTLGLSTFQQKRTAHTLVSSALFSSVDIVHLFASK
ncbi:hypothetical protein N310_10938, partial [Acanthisitta chloris]